MSAKKERIKHRAIVEDILKGGVFLLCLEEMPEHKIEARLCGKMKIRRIVLIKGDNVDVELSPYDLHKGRIMWRN